MKVTIKGPIAAKSAGFSLVELMIVVSIIGVLAALAVPRFTKFQAKAKQSEARTNLSHIYTLQMSAHSENDSFTKFSNAVTDTKCSETGIGFAVDPCGSGKVRYSYNTVTASATVFRATATAPANKIVTNCSGLVTERWDINQNKQISDDSGAFNTKSHRSNSVYMCK